jgi:hypothetical protein
MLMELPRTVWNDKKENWEDEALFINPFHLVAIEKDPQDAKCCIIIMTSGVQYYIKHTRLTLRKKIESYLKENVLSKIYKEMKDQQN